MDIKKFCKMIICQQGIFKTKGNVKDGITKTNFR